ncbi:hypothetical protein V8D89_012296 [Ganoderma adspersum]
MNPPPFRPTGISNADPGFPPPLHPQWRSLSVTPWSLARLKAYINPLFPAGAIVALSNEILVAQGTPTRYEGQGTQDLVVKLNVTDGTAYTTSRITIPNHPRGGIKIPIQNGTVGRVTKVMTATDRPRTKTQEATSKREDWWYVLAVGVRKTQWQWIRCQDWIPVGLLEPVHPRDPVALAHDNRVMATETSPAMFTAVSFTALNA